MKNKHLTLQLALAMGLALLLSASAFAQDTYSYRADRISTQGRITSVTRQGDMYMITLNHGGYTYDVPLAIAGARNLQVGDLIRINGLVSGDLVNTDLIALPGETYYVTDPMYRGVPYGSSGWMTGTVQSLNRHLGYLVVRDDATGANYKIDVRHMDRQRPVNVWGIRPGDHISINGGWEKRDTFNAVRIEY